MTQGCLRAAFFWSAPRLMLGACLCVAFAAFSQNQLSLPNPRMTPGALDPTVTPQNVQTTVCVKGYTATVRPDKRFTNQLKREQMRLYGYADANPQHYEEDHLIPLNIGGNPSDARNLWPQPRYGAWSADQKNDLEFVVYKLVCSGQLDLKEAQQRIAHNWIDAYQAWVPSHLHLLPKGRRATE